MAQRLVLIEGLFGSGKSTLAARLADTLATPGATCRAYHEFAADHPLPVDPSQIAALIQAPDVLGWAERLWRSANLTACADVVILESRLLQVSAMFPLLADTDPEQIQAMLQRVYPTLLPLNPALIVFDHSDPMAAFARTIQVPDRQEWLLWVAALAEQLPWLKSRGLHGVEGWLRFVAHWADVLRRLSADYPLPRLCVMDAGEDRAAAARQIDAFLEGSG